jgi:hypothetical protein
MKLTTHLFKRKPKFHLKTSFILLFAMLSAVAFSQTVFNNYNASFSTYQNKNVELRGKGMLTVTASSNALNGSTVNLASDDAWIYFPNVSHRGVIEYRAYVNGAAANHGSNCRVVIYIEGAIVIPLFVVRCVDCYATTT